jgi:hypothetical protein
VGLSDESDLLIQAGRGQELVNKLTNDRSEGVFPMKSLPDMVALAGLAIFTNRSVGLSRDSILEILVAAYMLGRRDFK